MDAMSQNDRRNLAELTKKLQIVKDYVGGVVRRRHTGFFIGGRAGIGKSYTVEGELTRLGEPYKMWNSAMTPRALFDRLAAYPDSTHLFEDIETVTKNLGPSASSEARSGERDEVPMGRWNA